MSKKIRAVSSTVNTMAYLAILFAMPIGLWLAVGWPLPTFMPNPQVIGETLSGNRPLPDTFVPKTLAVGLWFIWMQLVYITIVEMVSLLQGKLASRTHTLPGLQLMTGRAIATIAFLATSLFARPVGAAPLPLVETSATQVDIASETNGSSDLEASAVNKPVALDQRLRYSVEPGDSWWSIAEQQLGSGHRWQYLREANIGQIMSDSSQVSHQTDILLPGWQLLVPEAESASVETVEVQQGDTLWSIAQAELPAEADAGQIQDVVDTIAQKNDITNPNVVHPGMTIDLTESLDNKPEVARASQPDNAEDSQMASGQQKTQKEEILLQTPPEPSQQYVTSLDVSSQSKSSAVASSTQPPTLVLHETPKVSHVKSERALVEAAGPAVDAAAFFVGLGIGGSILAAKVLMRLRARKQYQLAHREPGAMPKEFDGPLAIVERALYERAEEAELFWIGKALRSLAARPVWDGEKIPQPILAQIDAKQIEVVFESADAVGAPIPWVSTNEGASWRLPRQVDHEDIPSSEALSPTPTFITAGKNVMINLESLGILNVVGSDEQRQGFVRSIVHEIAFSDSAGFVDIFTTAKIAGAETHALVRVASIEDILEETVTWLDNVDTRFATGEISNAYAYRLHNSEDPIAPVLVVLDEKDVKKSVTLLRLAAKRNKPVCVLVLSDTAVLGLTEFVLQFETNNKAFFDPFALEIEPQIVSADAARKLGDISKESKQQRDQSPIEVALETVPVVASLVEAKIYEETDAETNVFVDDDSQTIDMRLTGPLTQISLVETEQTAEIETVADDFPIEPGELRISILGHVDIAGVDVELTRQQLSLLTFLACKESATRDTIVDAIWDGQVISKSRFPNLLAETRSKIGRKYLPEATNGLYRLAHSTTDLQLFKKGLAEATVSSEPLREITRSLTLIRGVPLTVSNSRFWSWVEHSHFAAGVTSLLADAASSAAESYSKAGDHRKAQWVCEQGLLASPLDEHLIVKMTKTYIALGKPTLARRLVESWEAQVSSLNCGEPSDIPRKHLAG